MQAEEKRARSSRRRSRKISIKIPPSTTAGGAQASFRVNDNSFTTTSPQGEKLELRVDHQGLTISPRERYTKSGSESPSYGGESMIRNIEELKFTGKLGHGQSSVVEKAVHQPTGTLLAVKRINVMQRKKRKQFIREIVSLHKSKCESLVDFHSAFYSKGQVFVCLEYMNCGCLSTVLKKVEFIPEQQLKKITLEVLKGIHYLHSDLGVIHRDLKPENVLLNSNGQPKLTDFGISREMQSSMKHCRTVCGTFTYMSPERIRGESYSFQSDIWGLGILLLECATGKYPYPEANTGMYMELIDAIVNKDVPKGNASFSNEFHDFVKHCLNKDPSKRATSAQLLSHPWFASTPDQESLRLWIEENHLVLKD